MEAGGGSAVLVEKVACLPYLPDLNAARSPPDRHERFFFSFPAAVL